MVQKLIHATRNDAKEMLQQMQADGTLSDTAAKTFDLLLNSPNVVWAGSLPFPILARAKYKELHSLARRVRNAPNEQQASHWSLVYSEQRLMSAASIPHVVDAVDATFARGYDRIADFQRRYREKLIERKYRDVDPLDIIF